ncbi:hypothetical protein HDG38_006696 [Paraburkholderia sp. WSM4177]|nr:hypothetical protein [Paraburkholderia sp. WSM4177]MBB5488464.1 hypothetical protein [Paraburkholderia sp. WSM4180]
MCGRYSRGQKDLFYVEELSIFLHRESIDVESRNTTRSSIG